MKKSLKILLTIIVSLCMSLISFKQLFLCGVEDKFLDLKSVIITPFVLGYSLLGLLLFPFIISFYK
jgi:hypothetical protein